MSGKCAQCGGYFDHGKALARLVAERRAQDGRPHSERDPRPFDFALWLRGVNEGRADAATRGEEQAGVLL